MRGREVIRGRIAGVLAAAAVLLCGAGADADPGLNRDDLWETLSDWHKGVSFSAPVGVHHRSATQATAYFRATYKSRTTRLFEADLILLAEDGWWIKDITHDPGTADYGTWSNVFLKVSGAANAASAASVAQPGVPRDAETSCLDQLKQLGRALEMFAIESEREHYPELSSARGRLMFSNKSSWNPASVYPRYASGLRLFVCPDQTGLGELLSSEHKVFSPDLMLDDHSYFYLGHVVQNDADMRAFAQAYKAHVAKGSAFDEDLVVPAGQGSAGSDRIFRLRQGIERFLITDINDPAASASRGPRIPLLIERVGNHEPRGGHVLYLGGYVEYIRYPGKWPMTETTVALLEGLDALK